MIFIGPKLSEQNAHFVNNIINSIGSGNDLIIDLKTTKCNDLIFKMISDHIKNTNDKIVIYNAYEDEEFIIDFHKEFPNLILFTFFSDDEWRHETYNRYIALYSDFFSITSFMENLNRYSSYGLKNGMICQWACNPKKYFPNNIKKTYNVSFIGAPHSKRVEYISYLINNGIDVSIFGYGWNKVRSLRSHWRGYLSDSEMVEIINKSKINLNFLWTSRMPYRTSIKGRSMEIPACKSFQLSNFTSELNHYGFIEGVTIATFSNKKDMLDKIKFYLNEDEKREIIANNAYNLVINKHTWEKRFNNIFNYISYGKKENEIPRFKILVLNEKNMKHSINVFDSRIEIIIKKKTDYNEDWIRTFDGIVILSNHTNIDNEVLYMMAFAQYCDQSNVAISNFYFQNTFGKIWIRFDKHKLSQNIKLTKYFPTESIYYSSNYFLKNNIPLHKMHLNQISVVEYPRIIYINSFKVKLFLIRLFLSVYPKKYYFINSIKKGYLFNAFNIFLDYFIQDLLLKRKY